MLSKCEHLALSRTHDSSRKFFFDNWQISSVCRVKDVGVFISKDLKWASHISYIHIAASACAFHILRAFSSNNVWSGHYVKLLSFMSDPYWSTTLRFGHLILKKR